VPPSCAAWTPFTPDANAATGNGPSSTTGGHEDPVNGATIILEKGPWTVSAGLNIETVVVVERGHAVVLGQSLDEGDAISLRAKDWSSGDALVTGTGVALVASSMGVQNVPDGPMFCVAHAAASSDVPTGGGGTARLAYADDVLSVFHTKWSGSRRQLVSKGIEVIWVIDGGGALVSADDPKSPMDSEFPRDAPDTIPVWIEGGTWTLLHEHAQTEAFELFFPAVASRDLAQAP
jgi:hypothetical protein